MNIKYTARAVCVLLIIFVNFYAAARQAYLIYPIIPYPTSLTPASGSFIITPSTYNFIEGAGGCMLKLKYSLKRSVPQDISLA